MTNDPRFDRAQRQYDNQSDEVERSEDEEQSRREAREDWEERKAEEAREELFLESLQEDRRKYPTNDKYSGLGECKENE